MTTIVKSNRPKKNQGQDVKNLIKNMSKETLAAALAKKKECNALAMKVICRLIEPNVAQSWLLENLKHINQCHFQDVVEERAISGLCGYPLCDEELTDTVRKMYKICTKKNKVYTTADRKLYCSNTCYQAGIFLKNQLFTSPLWLRDCENHIEYRVISESSASKDLCERTEIDIRNISTVKINQDEEGFQNIQEANASNCNMVISKQLSETNNMKEQDLFTNEQPNILHPLLEINTSISVDGKNNETKFYSPKKSGHRSNSYFPVAKLVNNHNIRPQEVIKKIPNSSSKKVKIGCKESEPPLSNMVSDIELCIQNWFTLETLQYLLGQAEVSKLSRDGNEETSLINKNHLLYCKYQEINRKLNILELKADDKQVPTKPIPEIDALQKQADDLELKVKAFFRGDLKVKFAPSDDETENIGNKSENYFLPVLPHIDKYTTNSTRQRIFLEKLYKVLPIVQNALELSQFQLDMEIQKLVSTFSLGPAGICLRPFECFFVAIVLIKFLTVKSQNLNIAYSSKLTQQNLNRILLPYGLDACYLDRFISRVMEAKAVALKKTV